MLRETEEPQAPKIDLEFEIIGSSISWITRELMALECIATDGAITRK